MIDAGLARRPDRQPGRRRRSRRPSWPGWRRSAARSSRSRAAPTRDELADAAAARRERGRRAGRGRRRPAPLGRALGARPRSSSAALIEGLPGAAAARAVRLRGPLHARARPRACGSRRRRRRTRCCWSSSTSSIGAGLATEIVAAGGLGTWDITGANPRITEIHAGSYIFTDAFHRNLVPGFEPALTVLATVISRQRRRWRCSTAAASRSASTGRRPSSSASTARSASNTASTSSTRSTRRSSSTTGRRSAVGDRVELMPGYAPTTVNFYDIYYVVDGGWDPGRVAGARPLRQPDLGNQAAPTAR